jgi:two-component system sensor histidine kinase MprB
MTLRTRLALGLMLAVAVGAIVFGVAARATVERVLYADVDRQLVDEVDRAADDLGGVAGRRGPFGRGGLRDRFGDAADGRPGGPFFGPRAAYAQIIGPDGTVQVSTSSAQAIGGLPKPEVDGPRDGTSLRTVRLDHEPFRLAERVAGDGRTVQVARPLDELGGFLRTLRWVLVVAGAIALMAALAFGRWAARATLQPVEHMTRTARTIARSPRDLSARIEPVFPDPELAEFAESLNEMLDSIEASDLQQRRFVADASHELRTPLTSLGGNASYLSRTTEMSEDAREAIAAVGRDVDRLIRIADGLTTLARLDATPVTQLEPVDVDAIARETVERSRSLHPDHAFELRGSAGTHLLDAELVRRILGNLLDNAGRYTPAGSHVGLELGRDGEWLRVVVQDDGPGLDDVERAKVLERFHRGSTSAGIPGTGLGLSIVAEAATALGGSVELGTQPPHGLRCEVRLPAA